MTIFESMLNFYGTWVQYMRSADVRRVAMLKWGKIRSHLSDFVATPFQATVAAILVLVAVNLLFFWPHYLGRAIFPWDFCFAYHYFAYAWITDGGLFHPPLWMPYGSLGYPSHLTIQNSSFYPPAEIIGWLGLTYSLHVATIVQCLHILAGGIGCYALLRTNRLNPLIALTGALAFLLSGGFFSNGQHVDIIRGYALTPWLLAAYSPAFLNRPAAAAGTALVSALFVMGAYPGIIVATAFGFVIYLAWCLAVQVRPETRLRYVSFVALSAVLAIMLVSVKYLPLALQLNELALGEKEADFSISPICYLTALFRFDLENIPGDVTMRCLYLPSLILITLAFLRRLTTLGVLGIAFALFAILFATDGSFVRAAMMHVPGFTISRFHLSDYRGFLHLGFILIGASALQQLSETRMKFSSAAIRGIVALILALLTACLACSSGYGPRQIVGEFAWLIVGTFALVLCAPLLASRSTGLRVMTHAIFWAIMVLGTFTYVNHKPLTWKYADYRHDLERIVYQRPISKVFEPRHRLSKWPARPARILDGYGTGAPDFGLGYYFQMFGIGGDDKGVRLARTTAFKEALKSDTSGTFLQFMSSASQVALTTTIPSTTNALHQALVFPPSEARASIVEYGLSHAVYNLDLPQDMWMTENEIFFPGWQSKLRYGDIEKKGPTAEAVLPGLRSWHLPAGQYQFTTAYSPPGWTLAWALSLTGLAGCIGLLVRDVATRGRGRRQGDSPSAIR